MKFNLKINEIRAALLICSKDETRYVLCSIHVELKPKQQPLIVATDGRRLVVINSEAPQEAEPEKRETVNISADALLKIIKVCERNAEYIHFEANGKELSATIIGMGLCLRFNADAIIDASYPKWRVTLPKESKTPVSEIGFNAIWAADFSRALRILGSDTGAIKIRMTDEMGAFTVRSDKVDNFLGVLMPCQVSIQQWNPLWIGVDEEEQKK